MDDLRQAKSGSSTRPGAAESEQKYRHLFETLTDAAFLVDAETGRILEANPQAGVLLAKPPSEIVGMHHSELHPPHMATEWCVGSSGLGAGGETSRCEGEIVREDGLIVPVTVSASSFGIGERRLVIAVFRDVAERNRANQEKTAVLDSMSELVIYQSPDKKIRWVNRAAARSVGTTPEQLVGQHCYTVWHQRQEPCADCPVTKALQKGRFCDGEITTPDGRIWHVQGQPIRNASGKIEGVVEVTRDITGRKRLEEELSTAGERAEQARQELEQAKSGVDRNAAQLAEALFEAASQKKELEQARQAAEEANRIMNNILSSVSSIVIAVDENNRVTQWNPAAERTFNVPAAQATGTPFGQCAIEWDSTETIETMAACREADRPVHLDEVRFARPDGTTGLLRLSINPMADEHGVYSGFVLLGSDVTDRKVMEEELSRAQKLESVGALAAGIAHEINTPIQFVGDNTRFLSDSFEELGKVLQVYHQLKEAIEAQGTAPELLGQVNAAEDEADVEYLNEEIPKAIDQTLDGVERVAKIVRAMKDFSHPDQGEKALADLNQALDSTLTVARNELKYVADVVTDYDAALPPVPCYLSDMNQVFLNLLVNAAHAIADVVGDGKSGEATGKGTISVTTRAEGAWAAIRIADTGTGIPEHARDRIFDPFFTTKTVGRGTGQGLSMAHKVVVDAHGGTLTFETEMGKGTTFTIRLPIDSGAEATGAGNE